MKINILNNDFISMFRKHVNNQSHNIIRHLQMLLIIVF